MKKFVVHLKFVKHVTVELEAEDQDKAQDEAYKIAKTATNKGGLVTDFDTDFDSFIEE